MDLLRKCNADNRPAGQRRNPHSSRPVGQADKANSSQFEPHEAWVNRLTFIEDFTLEHSPRGRRSASAGIAGCF
jgi:hypothetical protein